MSQIPHAISLTENGSPDAAHVTDFLTDAPYTLRQLLAFSMNVDVVDIHDGGALLRRIAQEARNAGESEAASAILAMDPRDLITNVFSSLFVMESHLLGIPEAQKILDLGHVKLFTRAPTPMLREDGTVNEAETPWNLGRACLEVLGVRGMELYRTGEDESGIRAHVRVIETPDSEDEGYTVRHDDRAITALVNALADCQTTFYDYRLVLNPAAALELCLCPSGMITIEQLKGSTPKFDQRYGGAYLDLGDLQVEDRTFPTIVASHIEGDMGGGLRFFIEEN